MTERLCLEHRAHADVERRYSFGWARPPYVSAADNDHVGATGTFLGTPLQGV